MLNERYRALLGQSGEWKEPTPPSRLPNEYQEVKYITILNDATNGYSNRIITNIRWERVTKVEATMDNVPVRRAIYFHGELASTPYIAIADSAWSLAGTSKISITPATSAEFLSMAGVRTLIYEFTSTNDKIMSFGGFNSSYWSVESMDWLEVKIYGDDNNTLLAHFIPCYRKSDNKVGMYDIAREQFFTNGSTDKKKGEFLAGEEV